MIEKFDHVYIDSFSRNSALAKRIVKLFPAEKISYVDQSPWMPGTLSAQEFDRSKKNIYVTPYQGEFFKRCPGSKPGLMCCNYFVLNLGLQCDMNCSYCYLQSFINSPVLTLYSNIERALNELSQLRQLNPHSSLRIGTGEVVDSLSLDPITLFSRPLIEFFQTVPKWTLEFKTKSDAVDQFLDCEHAGNVIVSWSINPQAVVQNEEHGTASLERRLLSAERVLKKKFLVAFHIDPMIYHPEWRDNYASLVDEICRRFTPEHISTISLGALRFQPEQRAMMRERFGAKSWVTLAETFVSRDGKMRYAQELRAEMLKFVLDRFKANNKAWRIFLCMETPETWLNAYASTAQHIPQLNSLFQRTTLVRTSRNPVSSRFSSARIGFRAADLKSTAEPQ
jgi:spore photoproduct lyase